jgi:hypothetical protein
VRQEIGVKCVVAVAAAREKWGLWDRLYIADYEPVDLRSLNGIGDNMGDKVGDKPRLLVPHF